jgi:ABC-type cobalt transport system substrate-binding protein
MTAKKSGLQVFSVLLVFLLFPSPARLFASESGAKWQGVDESVVEKVAHEHGREAHTPLINTDQGDLLLFVFLMAGAVGGFVAGYYWRNLMEQGKVQSPKGSE